MSSMVVSTSFSEDAEDSEEIDAGLSSEEESMADGAVEDDTALEVGCPRPSSWAPTIGTFQPYVQGRALRESQAKLVSKLTLKIKNTYRACNPNFAYSETFNPKRVLTKPSLGVANNGMDNVNSDLILGVNIVLFNSEAGCRYTVKGMLGQGTFGQVCKCQKNDTNEFVAVKIIKNQPAYKHQALVEIGILKMLNEKHDPHDKHHIVRLLDHFNHENHLCLVFELLTHNMYELLRQNNHRGLSMNLLRVFVKQLLESLVVLRDAGVIHCDLKPENILLKSLHSGEIKLVDFGSACMEDRTVYSYIQSRFYRSPEVLTGHQYTSAIDMWSLGCVAAELFLGLPLFPGASEYDLMLRMRETLGGQPPDHLLLESKQWNKFFKRNSHSDIEGTSQFTFLTETEFEVRGEEKPAMGKDIYKHAKLEDIVMSWQMRKEVAAETGARAAFVDFLRGLIEFDPAKRWTPRQALQHPWLDSSPFTGPFKPPPDERKQVMAHNLFVKHNPSRGHWSASGLSPQAVGRGRAVPMMISPKYSSTVQYGGSYGSHGSYGSVGEGCVGMGSSYGSYGESNMMYIGGGMATPPSYAASPEQGRRFLPIPAPTSAHLGMSPSGSGLQTMSLGTSPSQMTPPGNYFHTPLGTSPVSDSPRWSPVGNCWNNPNIHGGAPGSGPSSLGHSGLRAQSKQSRRSLPINAAVHPVGSAGSDGAGLLGVGGSSPWQRMVTGNSSESLALGAHWHAHPASLESTSGSNAYTPPTGSYSYGGNMQNPSNSGVVTAANDDASDGDDALPPPHPSDWDPHYSDELLLQEDVAVPAPCGPVGVMGSGGARLGPGPGPPPAMFALPPSAVGSSWPRGDIRARNGTGGSVALAGSPRNNACYGPNDAIPSSTARVAPGTAMAGGHVLQHQQRDAFQYMHYPMQFQGVYFPQEQDKLFVHPSNYANSGHAIGHSHGQQDFALRTSVSMGGAYDPSDRQLSSSWGNSAMSYGMSPPSQGMDVGACPAWMVAASHQALTTDNLQQSSSHLNAASSLGNHRRSSSLGAGASPLSLEKNGRILPPAAPGRRDLRRVL
eukprot:TRINITY_DN3616_c1_g1_i1.p1 TRINITY_DN3616_c1_g1~~TRINITY_DN3616_c1_g1_i1.p1  ORF type:complete len:1063 (+),score=171.96 TRINITY_DN3616_c1_g1_i1:66-3254(+)